MRPADLKRLLLLAAGILAGLLLAGVFLRHALSALLTALVFAYLLNPALKYIEKRGLGRFPAIAVLYLCISVMLFISLFMLVPYLNHQLESLPRAIPRYVRNLQQAMEKWKTELAPYYGSEEGEWLIAGAEESLNRLVLEFSGKGYDRLKGALFGLFDLVLAPILVFFILHYKEYFKELLLGLMPSEEHGTFRELGNRINRTLERFILAQFVDCLLVGVLSAFALYFLGIEFPLLNGLFAGFASVVPFVGVLVAVIPPAFIGYVETGDLTIIPKVCAAYFIINVIIEGNLIKPLLMRSTLKLNPLAVIFALMAMGELMGFWGIVLAVPMTAVVKIFTEEAQRYLKERDLNEKG